MWKHLYLLAILLTLAYTIPFTESTSLAEPYWVPFNPETDALPDDAIMGGYEDETLYIGRTLNARGYLVSGKYVNSTRRFTMPYYGKSHIMKIYEILCGNSYKWVNTTTDHIPDGAVVGGISDGNNETMYIGRAYYKNHVIPGKVKKTSCVAYIPYNQDEISLESYEILVALKMPQIIVQNSTVYDVIEGRDSSLRIPCEATGTPKPVITWRVNGRIITETEFHLITTYVPLVQNYLPGYKFSVDNGTLVFNEPEVADNETYMITCEAHNDAGFDNVTFQVNIRQQPQVTGKVTETAVIGETANIECNLGAGVPKPIIHWEFRAINDSTFVPVLGSNNTLSINYVEAKDAGTYKCIATNDVGVDEHLTELIVQNEPQIISNTTEAADVYTMNVILNNNSSFESESLVMETQNVGENTHVGFESTTSQVQTLKCLIPRKLNIDHAIPLISISSSATIWPTLDSTTNYLKVQPGQTVTFSCDNSGGKTSYFQEFPERNAIRASCIDEDRFMVEDKSYKISELLCAEAQIVATKKHEKCLTKTSALFRVGYEIQGFLETYEVCFDTSHNIPLYTHALISKSNHIGDVTYEWQKYPALDAHRDTYTCNNATSTCCYTKAQLLNARDVSAGPSQRTTFMDPLNAVPQWRPCGMSQSPWEYIEDSVRSLINTYEEIDVWSGTYMMQEDNGTSAPRYLWKVLRFEDTMSIAVVYVNGPSPSEADILCKNTCGDDGAVPWSYDYNEHTYCCNVDEFLHAFGLGGSAVGKATLKPIDKILRKKFSTSNLLLRKLTERTLNKPRSQNLYFVNYN